MQNSWLYGPPPISFKNLKNMSEERIQPGTISRKEFIKLTGETGTAFILSYLVSKKLLVLAEAIEAVVNSKDEAPVEPLQPKPAATPTPAETPKSIPETIVSSAPESQPRIYVVQKGENLFRIGLKYNLTINEMVVANNISSPFTIYPGQELIIPEKGVASTQEFSPLRVIIGEPKDYELTHKDERFLSWFNEKTKFWKDWNGNEHQYFIPKDVYRGAKTAEKVSGLPWYVLVAIGFTETGFYESARWNPGVTSESGASGRYQIMPFNWVFQPYEGSLYDPKLNALTATNYMLYLDLGDIDKNTWIWRFTGGNYTRPCWNLHSGQAEVTWEIMQYLKENYLFAMEHVK